MSQLDTRLAEQDTLLLAALAHVPFDGWSEKALVLGAQDVQMSVSDARRLYPAGGDDLLRHFNHWADRQMLHILSDEDGQPLRVSEQIKRAVRVRLQVMNPYKEAVRRAVPRNLFPDAARNSAFALWRTVDAMWNAAGDEATDYNRYTKRGLLAGVYSATFFYWLDDTSPDHDLTWAFLDRRIDNVLRLGQNLVGLKSLLPQARRPR